MPSVDAGALEEQFLREDVGKMLDSSSAVVDASFENSVFQWSNLVLRDAWDQLVLMTVAALATWVVGMVLECLVGTPMRATSAAVLVALVVVAVGILVTDMWRRGFGSAETRVWVASTGVAFLAALSTLLVPESILDFRLGAGLSDAAFRSIHILQAWMPQDPTTSSTTTTTTTTTTSPPTTSPPTPSPFLGGYLVLVAVVGAVLAGSVTMPAIRTSRLYHALLRDGRQWYGTKLLANLAVFGPLLVALVWLKPVLGASLLPRDLVKCSPSAAARDCPAVPPPKDTFWLSETAFLALRTCAILLIALCQLFALRTFAATHLRMARDASQEHVVSAAVAARALPLVKGHFAKKRTGEDGRAKKSRKRADDERGKRLQPEALKKLAQHSAEHATQTIFSRSRDAAIHLTVVAVHLAAPAIILLSLALLLLRFGQVPTHICPTSRSALSSILDLVPLQLPTPLSPDQVAAAAKNSLPELLRASLQSFLGQNTTALDATLHTVFSPVFWRPLLAFWLWFTTAWWALAATLSYAYWEAAFITTETQKEEQ